jgi:tRNA C32,U32 (ribose-2'-O)-methylase TrmJ
MAESNHQNLSVHTVLVRPLYSGNLGQAVRATANMGFGKVFVIDSKCEIDKQARQGAAGAGPALDEIKAFKDWNEFNKTHPNSFRIGLTRRIGKHRKLFPFEDGVSNYFEGLEKRDDLPNINKEIFLVFGPEDHGLASEDLDSVNICCHLPLYGEFKSLNLAQAVLLSQHITHSVYFKKHLSSFTANSEKKEQGKTSEEIAKTEFFPDTALLGWLKTLGFRIDPDKLNAFETIKKMILRGFPSARELGTFEKALMQSQKKLKLAYKPNEYN